jgi:hypothetical protein
MLKTIITNIEALKMTIHTKHFHPDFDKKLLCTCGHAKCDKRSVSQQYLNRLEKARVTANRALIVTSGGRCPYHPNEIHRTIPADHQLCQGGDISVAGGAERGQIVQIGIASGFNAIGVAKTFIHLGYRQGKPLVMWTYS